MGNIDWGLAYRLEKQCSKSWSCRGCVFKKVKWECTKFVKFPVFKF
jgi:hypothetical protein